MARKIKRITKQATFSLFWLGVFLFSLSIRFFVGGDGSNLSRLDSDAKKILGDSGVISAAQADAPDPSACSSCACTCGDGGGGGGD